MDLGLANKTALVVGGGGGLGSAIVRALAAEGAAVAVADVAEDAVATLIAELTKNDRPCLGLNWDLSDLAVIDQNVARIEDELGRIDILVNITGGPPPTPASGQPEKLWDDSFRSMVLSVIALTDRVLPRMRENRWGRIVTSTSSGVVAPIPNLAISNALRLSLVGWSKSLAREVAKDGITSNIIVPGRIATKRILYLDEMKAAREQRSVEIVAEESAASIPVGRYGTPEEYADVTTFLASTRASYVTGSVVRVDGGLIASI